jgi:desulfoferrodoxin-like iron-binding protein
MPTEANEVYECDICGAIIEVKEGGAGTLECCGQPMTLQE